nr:MAG TPA: hypothetical protein [Crassvirales sp.]
MTSHNQQPSLEVKTSLKVQRLTLETANYAEYNSDTSALPHRLFCG